MQLVSRYEFFLSFRSDVGGSLSRYLLKADVDVISNDQCSIVYPFVVTGRMLCAYRENKDACQVRRAREGSAKVKGINDFGSNVNLGRQRRPAGPCL